MPAPSINFAYWAVHGLLIAGIYCDLRYRKLPNWLSGLLLGGGYLLLVTQSEGALLERLPNLLAIAGLGLLVYMPGWLAGGDIKFAASLSLWLAPGHWLHFLVVLTLLGGLLATPVFLYDRFIRKEPGRQQATFPYGIAIAIAALMLITPPGL